MITDKELGLMISVVSVFSKQVGSSLLTRVALPPGGEMDTAAALRTHGEKKGKEVFVKELKKLTQILTKTRPRTQQQGQQHKSGM